MASTADPGSNPKTAYLGPQVERSWAKERRNLEWFGLRDGMSILDLGCGPGHFTERLADALPASPILALDADPAMLDIARARLQRFGGRVDLRQLPAEQTGLAGASFDAAIARLLFQHLARPLDAAREAHRLLRHGGRLVVTDCDDGLFGVLEPSVPGLDELMARYGRAQAARGGDRRIARWLPRLLAQAGFQHCELESIALHSDQAGLAACFPQLDEAALVRLANRGQLSPVEIAQYLAAHREFLAAPAPFALILLFMACGTKGAPRT